MEKRAVDLQVGDFVHRQDNTTEEITDIKIARGEKSEFAMAIFFEGHELPIKAELDDVFDVGVRYMVIYPGGFVTEGQNGGALHIYQEIMNGGYIELIPPDRPGISIYGHDEAKIINLPYNEVATGLLQGMLMEGDWIAGPVILVGYDPRTGEDIPLPDDIRVEETHLYCDLRDKSRIIRPKNDVLTPNHGERD